MGREIHRITIFDGHAYLAYGDYDANTGPIDVISIDLASFTVGAAELTAATEELFTMRVYDGELYLPHMDLRGFNDPASASYDVATAHGAWTSVFPDPLPTHVFDLVKTADGLFLFGSVEQAAEASGNAVIWRSPAGDGTSWDPIVSTGSGAFDRFYVAVPFADGTILAFAAIGDTGVEAWLWTAGGDAWEQLPDASAVGAGAQVSGNPAGFIVDGHEFWLCTTGGGKGGGTAGPADPLVISKAADQAGLASFAAALPFAQVFDACATAATLYVIGNNAPLGGPQLYSCDATGTWTEHGALDVGAHCLAVDEAHDRILLGTTDSWVVPIPIPS